VDRVHGTPPGEESGQSDGRLRSCVPVVEADGLFLRVVSLEDGETIYNAFFDRGFMP